jgi:hypothetical protein
VPVTGSPEAALASVLWSIAASDGPLIALVGADQVVTALRLDQRTPFPCVVVGRREFASNYGTDRYGGAMQVEGGRASIWIDVWSAINSPVETQTVLSRLRVLFQRVNLVVPGFVLIDGSLTCQDELCFQDDDPDDPQRRLFHGVQRWTALLEEVA